MLVQWESCLQGSENPATEPARTTGTAGQNNHYGLAVMGYGRAASPTATAFALRRRRPHCCGVFGYTWVSFGLEVASWLPRAIFRAARAAHTVVNWVLLGCAGGGVDTTELLEGGGSVRSRARGVDQIFTVRHYWMSLRSTVLVLDASSAGRSSRSSVVISPAGANLPWD